MQVKSKRLVPLGVSVASVIVTLGTALPVSAQNDSGDERLEEVVVTGTRITRRDYVSNSPISTVDQTFLEFSGQPTLEEALNQMPQVQPDFGRSSNNPGDGTSRINLRGLGAERTLVMLNGRRLAPSGAGSAVDVNNLPRALIERVEIITGGASTVYGSDAISGVVNFITLDKFAGLSLDASTYITEQGDSEVTDINIVYGNNFADGRGNITLFGGYLERKASFAADRDISRVPLVDDLNGSLQPTGSGTTPDGSPFFPRLDLGNGPVATRFAPNGDIVEFIRPDDVYNFAPLNYLQVPLTRYTAGLFANYDLGANLEAYTELTFTRNESGRTLAPVPAADFFEINLDSPFFSDQSREIAANQFLPAGPGSVAFGLRRRLEELGAREFDSTRDYTRAVVGLRGSLNDTWDFDSWAVYTDGSETELQLNGASASRIQQGLLVNPATGECFDPANGCVPVNLLGAGNFTDAAADFIRLAPLTNRTQREQKLVSAFVTGAPFELWAGAVDIALGLEWRSDSVDFRADPSLQDGDALGYLADASISGEETVFELYGEAIVPLLQDAAFARYLGLEMGYRYSDYDNAGSVESWKFGGQWEVIDGVRFRSILQRSVRAPNLTEAFQEQRIIANSFVRSDPREDPCSASANPVASGNAERCVLQGIPVDQLGIYEAALLFPTNFIDGGNPDLAPETADTFTFGVILEPARASKWQLAIDYFDLEVTDTIGSIDPAAICFDPANTENLFCENITRDPVSYNVTEVFALTSNRGLSAVEGIDTQISYATDLPGWMSMGGESADLRVNLIWTHLLDKTVQANPASTPLDCTGRFGWPCDQDRTGETFPDDRITSNFLYRSGKLTGNLTWRWISGSDNAAPLGLAQFGFLDPVLAIPSIGSTNYFDLGVGYDFTDNINARLNVSNLLDQDPPLMADAVFANNTDTAMYDIFGRAYQLSLFLRF